MIKRSLQTGVAYHGNRMPTHVRTDMEKIAMADMDIVVHMLSHIDWERHKKVMEENFRITEAYGLEVWVDNWGLGGAPGDTSHFLCEHPEAHMVYSNGTVHPRMVCLNHPAYLEFNRQWLDTVAEMGGKTIFWDEPNLPRKVFDSAQGEVYTCACPHCQKLFEEQYGHPMPLLANEEVNEFRINTLIHFFRTVTDYSASLGMKNVCCFMPPEFDDPTMFSAIRRVTALPHMDNMGTDPYWFSRKVDSFNPYQKHRHYTEKLLTPTEEMGKDHNLWIQTYDTPAGREEEIIVATEGAYDAGAKCLLAWSFMGGESNNYRSDLPERTWCATVEAFRRVRAMERDRILAQNRAAYLSQK